ncbi:MAG: UDP-N-acetylglucosamine 1-carboxyvinyltransferase [candidate division WOR-3 bacterium]|nr:UDP-N-acetylglucosamine 1-carboxyvinyltransferase [candidate division WOR-3 bacterium]
MDKFIIEGGNRLEGEVEIKGAKNSILPILAATLLTEDEFVIENVPLLRDIFTMKKVLETLGASVSFNQNVISVDTRGTVGYEAPYELVKQMRASYYVLGPLLGRLGRARVSLPGGCAIGQRPVDLHIKGLRELGANISVVHGYIEGFADKLEGSYIFLEGTNGPSVGATINTMMAASRASGNTIIEGAAMEPEVMDVANFLNRCGAKIRGHGTRRVEIKGVKELSGCRYRVIPDRIEAGTFAVAAAITKGEVFLQNAEGSHLEAVLKKLEEIGVSISRKRDGIKVKMDKEINSTDIETGPYPGFPTDMQAQFTSLLSLSNGVSVVRDKVFEGRFMHVPELVRMGANLRRKSDYVIVKGVPFLSGAKVMASDLRASAALVLAGLAASGTTEIRRIYHIDRGYENIEKRLQSLGAQIWRRGE